MKEPIPHGAMQNYLAATQMRNNAWQGLQDYTAQATAGVENSINRFEAYKEYNRQRALQDELIERERAQYDRSVLAHDKAMHAQDLQIAAAQNDLNSYDKRLAAQIAAQNAATHHTQAQTALINQDLKEKRDLEKMRTPPTTPKPKPTKIESTPLKKPEQTTKNIGVPGATLTGSPLTNWTHLFLPTATELKPQQG